MAGPLSHAGRVTDNQQDRENGRKLDGDENPVSHGCFSLALDGRSERAGDDAQHEHEGREVQRESD